MTPSDSGGMVERKGDAKNYTTNKAQMKRRFRLLGGDRVRGRALATARHFKMYCLGAYIRVKAHDEVIRGGVASRTRRCSSRRRTTHNKEVE